MSITYRYVCATEDAYVEETRLASAGVPTVCKNGGHPLISGSIVIVKRPEEYGDILFVNGSEANFTGASIVGLSHGDLEDIGTHDHTDIDAHINNASIHRSINDSSVLSTDLWSASKINSVLTTKSNTGHTHVAADVTDFSSAADARISAQKASANGLATLDSNSKIPTSQIPSLAITTVSVVNTIAERNALSVDTGDVCKVIDSDGSGNPQTYIWGGSSWIDFQETSNVVSVAGRTGVVVLDTSDVSEASNLYYTEARVSANTNVSQNTTHRSRTDNPHNVTKAQVGLGDVANLKVNLSATTNPSGGNDITQGYSIGSRWINVSSDHEFVCTDNTEGAALWKNTTARIEQLSLDFSTKSSTYSVGRTFLFRGISLSGISSLKVVACIDNNDNSYTFDLRIVDYDNDGAVIAEATGLSGSTKSVRNLGSLSNVPSSDHVLELQVRRSGNVSDIYRVYVYAIVIEYN